jgi:hypothetical protein
MAGGRKEKWAVLLSIELRLWRKCAVTGRVWVEATHKVGLGGAALRVSVHAKKAIFFSPFFLSFFSRENVLIVTPRLGGEGHTFSPYKPHFFPTTATSSSFPPCHCEYPLPHPITFRSCFFNNIVVVINSY